MRIHDAVLGIVIVLFGVLVIGHAATFPIMPGQAIGPSTFPTALGIGFVICGSLIAVPGIRQFRKTPVMVLADGWKAPRQLIAATVVIVGTAACALAFEAVGFPISVVVLTFGLLLLMRYRPMVSLGISIAFVSAIYWIMARQLLVPLPLGPLEFLLR